MNQVGHNTKNVRDSQNIGGIIGYCFIESQSFSYCRQMVKWLLNRFLSKKSCKLLQFENQLDKIQNQIIKKQIHKSSIQIDHWKLTGMMKQYPIKANVPNILTISHFLVLWLTQFILVPVFLTNSLLLYCPNRVLPMLALY